MLRRIAVRLLIILSVALVLLAAVAVQPAVQTRAVNAVLRTVTRTQPFSVQLEGVMVRPSGLIEISELRVFNDTGTPVLRAQHLAASLDWLALLRRRVAFRFLSGNDITIHLDEQLIRDLRSQPEVEESAAGSRWSLRFRRIALQDIGIVQDLVPAAADIPGRLQIRALDLGPGGAAVRQAEVGIGPLQLQVDGQLNADRSLAGRIAARVIGGEQLAEMAGLLPGTAAAALDPYRLSASLSAGLGGSLEELDIEGLSLDMQTGTDTALRAALDGQLQPQSLEFQGMLSRLEVDGLLPAQVQAAGEFRGSPQEVELAWEVSYGMITGRLDAAVKGVADGADASTSTGYNLRLRLGEDALNVVTRGELDPVGRRLDGDLHIEQLLPHGLGLPVADVQLSGSADYAVNWGGGTSFRLMLQELLLDSAAGRQRLADTRFTGELTSAGVHLDMQGPGILASISANQAMLAAAQRAAADPLSALEQLPESASAELSLVVDAPAALLPPLIPGLQSLSPLTLGFRLEQGRIFGSGSLAELELTDVAVHQLSLTLAGDLQAVEYRAAAEGLRIRDYPPIIPEIAGRLDHEHLELEIGMVSAEGLDLVDAAAVVRSENGGFSVQLQPPRLRIWGQTWELPAQHRVWFYPDRIDLQGIEFRRRQTLVALDGVGPGQAELRIRGLDLSTLPAMDGVAGMVAADARLRLEEQIAADFQLQVDGLQLFHRPIGDLEVSGAWQDRLDAELQLQDNDSRIAALGWLDPASGELELELDLTTIDIDYLRELLPDEIEQPAGSITGGLRLSGRLDDPTIDGRLQLRGAGFRVARLGTAFTIGSQSIHISNNRVRLDNLELRDSQQRSAVLQGELELSADPDDFRFDVGLQSSGIQVMDTTAQSGAALYGQLLLGSNLRLAGSLASPRITGSIEAASDTSLTAALPQTRGDAGIGRDIVRFRDPGGVVPVDAPEPLLPGVEVSALLRIDPDARLTLLIDPRRGDRLQVRGGVS